MVASFAAQWYRFGDLYKAECVFDVCLAAKNRRGHLNLGRRRNFFNIGSILGICPFPVGRQLAEQRLGITLPAWRQAQVHALRVTCLHGGRVIPSRCPASCRPTGKGQIGKIDPILKKFLRRPKFKWPLRFFAAKYA